MGIDEIKCKSNWFPQECRRCEHSNHSIKEEPCCNCLVLRTEFEPIKPSKHIFDGVVYIDPAKNKCKDCQYKISDRVCALRENGGICVNYDQFKPKGD